MALRQLFILLFFFYSPSVTAQLTLVKGNVADVKNNIKLSGVTVKVGEYATRTDKDGRFEIAAPLKSLIESGISFSYIGYLTTRLIYQSNHFYEVDLLETNTSLNEVIIGIRGEDIIKKAIKKIPENYPDKPTSIKGILRIQKWRNQSQYFKSDAIIQAYIPAYTDNEKTTVTVLHNQLDTIHDKTIKYIRNVSSYNLVEFGDVAHNKDLLKSLLKKRKFDYRLVGKQLYKNHKVFVINSVLTDSSKKYSRLEATLYIDTASYAFVAANLTYYNIPRFGPFIARKEISRRVAYEKIGNKWYLSEAHMKNIAEYKSEEPYSAVDFVRIGLDTVNVKKSAYKDIVQNMDDVVLINKPLDGEEWAKYENLFKAAEVQGKIETIPVEKLDTIKKNNIAASINYKKPFGRKVYDYLRGNNNRTNYGVFRLPIDVNNQIHGVPESIFYGLGLGSDYRVYKNLFFGFQANSNFWNKKKIGLSSFALSLSHEFILNKSQRNIVLTPQAGYELLTINYEKQRKNYNTINYGLLVSYDLSHTKALFLSSTFNPSLKNYTLNTLSIKPTGYSMGFGIVLKR